MNGIQTEQLGRTTCTTFGKIGPYPRMKIVVVIPVCNEQHTLETLTEGIVAQLSEQDYRILFVDDGSTDTSYRTLLSLRQSNDRIDVIKFAENSGKTRALHVAFSRIDADVVVTMDADLQDDPKELPRLLAALDEGLDLVCGWKEKRHDPLHKTLPSKVYNGLITRLFGIDIHDVNTGFKAMRGEVARSLTLYADFHRLLPVMAAQGGYRVGEIPVEHHPRRFGKSKYGFSRFYEGVRDAGRLWIGARAERFAWISVDRFRIGLGVGVLLCFLGILFCWGGVGLMPGVLLIVLGALIAVTGLLFAIMGSLSRAVGILAEEEAQWDGIEEEHVGAS